VVKVTAGQPEAPHAQEANSIWVQTAVKVTGGQPEMPHAQEANQIVVQTAVEVTAGQQEAPYAQEANSTWVHAEARDMFNDLKKAFNSILVLRHPNPALKIRVEPDTSGFATILTTPNRAPSSIPVTQNATCIIELRAE
jgi:hypothetical protein